MDRYQHPGNNAVLGAPEGMSHEQCQALPITRIRYADGSPAVISYWMPSEAERALIASGRPVRLIVMGNTHPPLSVTVEGDGTLPEIEPA